MKTAHYFASGKTKFIEFGWNGKLVGSERIRVVGKVDARATAKRHNAKPWNF
ncbi:hypothetical protein QJS83_14950 [Bdellovibrio sp. 22V]|uniref:hypothetical protein n=1 Tax=Bdellovibrio sp. 22V TaxID=3044166 RepID=UPI002542FEED|nr:hypothetical protein [Bdellovibrio sp. 22V]WII71761.1 hypothetical protein QJS83_14950 [Bdellovibrio sp. 22V]